MPTNEPDGRTTPSPIRQRLTRRAFVRRCLWGGGGGVALGGISLFYARYVEPFWPKVEQVTMDLPGLGPETNGMRLVQISDVHLADQESQTYLMRELDRVAALHPDLVFLTGDFVSRGDPVWIRALGPLISRIRSKGGIYAILGNHDYGVYRSAGGRTQAQQRLAQWVAETLGDSGVRVLRNERVILSTAGGPIQLVGVDDLWGGCFEPDRAFADVRNDQPCIVLMHNPDGLSQLEGRHWNWLLCGHTHGGQVRLPWLGAIMLPVKNTRFDQGLFELDSRKVYVNRGLGYLRPVRLNCRPEITVFTVNQARDYSMAYRHSSAGDSSKSLA